MPQRVGISQGERDPMNDQRAMTRRGFMKRVAAATAAPAVIPSSALGQAGAAAPGERITMGCIGLGGQGTSNLRAFLGDERVQVVAVCDVDAAHRERARNIVGLQPADAYNDFRDVIARDDIDCISIGTPDHWHAIITIEAAKAGKDVYCEKPLSLTLAEGRAMSDTVSRLGRVLQTGTWRRSRPACLRACELVRNGYIGNLHTIRCGVPEGFQIRHGDFSGIQPPMPVPEGFDYDMWLGPAPDAPYTQGRCHFNFRWILDYGAGYITDWGAHYYDVAQWGNGTDLTGPVAIDGTGEFPPDGLYNAQIKHHLEFTYANGVKLVAFTSKEGKDYGTRFEGDEGWIYVESGSVISERKSLETVVFGPDAIRLYNSPNHHRNFIDCVKSRQTTAAPVEVAHRSASLCHLGSICTLVGRKLRWDPAAERFHGDDEANRLLGKAMRAPWHV
jgi:predicted dehydrogenase